MAMIGKDDGPGTILPLCLEMDDQASKGKRTLCMINNIMHEHSSCARR